MSQDDDLFADALELPAGERPAFLDRACAGDPARRARLAALLAGHEAAGRFLQSSPVVRPDPLPEAKAGDVIGRYTLIRKIGDGGCGVVYLAEQHEPLRRQVALKVIRLGMDTREVIARFDSERQVLAMMDHPDIARVFDAGSTAAGRPFFAMEFVDGVPITEFCDEHNLDMTARLHLFARVCVALQHAHQKGIIHRDLKPSNILVAMRDGAPAPKIIDFGIAKATHGRLAEHTLLTGFGQFIGTPAYMSPEQAEFRELEMDTRSDIYSLGVLLYELLAGRPPYDPAELVRAGLDEIRRIIREVEPPRPSTRVSTLTGADRDAIARRRNAAPLQLSAVLRGDLDWIVMRCLEKDRARRYATAHELADDVRRHLRQEPVVARPPTSLYRARKFVARHRLACASAAALALSLILGTVISARQAVRATRAESLARTERDSAQAAQRAEATARIDAQRRQEQAEDLLAFMLGGFRADLKKIGKLDLLDAIADKAQAHFAALDPRDLTDAVLTSQAKTLSQIGETRLDQARYADATAAFTAAYSRAAALVARHPQNADMLFERAQAEFWLGFTARRRGDFPAAREWLTHYRDSALALGRLEPGSERAEREVASGRNNLAVLLFDTGATAAAREEFLTVYAWRAQRAKAQPDNITAHEALADTAAWLGRVAEIDGDYPEALRRYVEFGAGLDEIVTREPAVARWKYRRGEARGLTAVVLAIAGRRPEAEAEWGRAETELAALVAQDLKNRQWLIALLNARLQLARLQLAEDRLEPAASVIADTLTQLARLAEAEPESRIFSGRLVTAWSLEATRRHATSRTEGVDSAARAIALGDRLIAAGRADAWVHHDTARARLLAGRVAAALGRADEARAQWQQVVSQLTPGFAASNDWRGLDPLAQAHRFLGNAEIAHPLIERLKRFGYHPIDPLAGSTLGLAP